MRYIYSEKLVYYSLLSAGSFWKEVLAKHSMGLSGANVKGGWIILEGNYIFTFLLADTVR